MDEIHIADDNNRISCGVVGGKKMHFKDVQQKAAADINFIDSVCEDCVDTENSRGRVPEALIDWDDALIKERTFLGSLKHGGTERFLFTEYRNHSDAQHNGMVRTPTFYLKIRYEYPNLRQGWEGNPMAYLGDDVKTRVSDISLSMGYADAILHQIYPTLLGKPAPGCKIPEDRWGDHSRLCRVHGKGMFHRLRSKLPNLPIDIRSLSDEACLLEDEIRQVRDKLAHPWVWWGRNLVSKGGRFNPYFPHTEYVLSDGDGGRIPLSVKGLQPYADKASDMVKALERLQWLIG